MDHTNEIAIELLKDEYADYPHNWWHYDREYNLMVKAMDSVKNLNGETVKREHVCYAQVCHNNINDKCKLGDYHCSARINKHE